MVLLNQLYHLHVDGLTNNPEKLSELLGSFGILSDDFEHFFEIEKERVRPNHFTKIYNQKNFDQAQSTFNLLKLKLEEQNFQGHMQIEKIEEMITIGPHKVQLINNNLPFQLTQHRSEKYKDYELHLKISAQEESTIQLLRQTGLNYLRIKNYCFFTASGHGAIIKEVFIRIKTWLNQRNLSSRAELIFETTQDFCLFNLTPESFQDIATS
jgi:hypothetical protein